MHQYSYARKITPPALTRFLLSFNDSGFRSLMILAVCGMSWDYFADSQFLLVLLAACILPVFIWSPVAGYLADRLPKRYLMMLSTLADFIILFFGVEAGLNILEWGIWPVIASVFLMASVSAFFEPAFESMLPELFPETELTRANGLSWTLVYLGSVLGVGVMTLVFALTKGDVVICGRILYAAAVISMICSSKTVTVISAVQRRKELLYHFKDGFSRMADAFAKKPWMFMAGLGVAFFSGLGIAIQPLLVLFARDTLGLVFQFDTALIQFSPIAGMMIGCILAGIFSGRKTELGLVPLGALGMAVFFPLSVYCTGNPAALSVAIPHLDGNTLHIAFTVYFRTMLFLMAAGLSGALFVIPLTVYYQQRLPDELRGLGIACRNIFGGVFITILTALAFILALGVCKNEPEMPQMFRDISNSVHAFSPRTLLVFLGVLVFAMTAFTMWRLPNFMLRFLVLALGHSIYNIKVTGAENIPERGPVMLLSNHVSFIDGVLISSCTSRQIRFLLHEDYYAMPLVNFAAKLTGFFKVPAAGKSKSMGRMFEKIRDFLRGGGILCVYPEGRISRNGVMGRFKHGYEKMLPPELDVPVIPVNISFVWGSVFSYYFGKIRFRMPEKLPHFATVTIGRPVPRDSTPFEIRQKIAELSAEAAYSTPPDERTIHYALATQARRHPFRPLISDAGGESLSAFGMFVRSMMISRELRRLLPSETKYVGILLPNSTSAAVSVTSILLADKVPCPLNYSVTEEVFRKSVELAEISCIITSRAFLEKIHIPPMPQMIFIEDIVPKIPKWRTVATGIALMLLPPREFMNIAAPLSSLEHSDTAALLFSSGSTGTPKGIMLSHHNIASDVYSVSHAMGLSKDDVILGNLPLFHSFGLNVCFWMPVMYGVHTVFVSNPLDAALVCSTVEKYKVSLLFATPSFLQKYMRRATPGQLDTLRVVVTGAERLRKDIADKFRTVTNGRLEIVEGYGCTELSPVVTFNLAQDIRSLGAKSGKIDSIGVPLSNISVRILDPLTYKPVPPDTEGILFVKGPNVMQGYLKNRDLTNSVMRDGYYDTGDIAKMDEDGYVTICGRLSRFSKIAGEMVPHEMVEGVICEICASDERVVAVGGMPDPVKGEVLLVLYTDATPLSPEEIVDRMRERSISNLWIPKVVNFHKVDALPLLGSGKLDLSILRKIAEEIASGVRK